MTRMRLGNVTLQ